MMVDTIKIDGLDQFVRNLKKLDADLPKTLRVGLNAAAQIIVDYSKPRVPHRSGRAAKSIRASSTRSMVRVSEGGARAPYMPWLDFGGTIGKRSAKRRKAEGGSGRTTSKRPFLKEGRFLYAGLAAERDKIHAAVETALLEAAAGAGIEVD